VRWAVELTIKELKGGLHLGRMQVSQDAERVERSVVLPVCAYLLLVHLYGQDQAVSKGWSLFQLKRRASFPSYGRMTRYLPTKLGRMMEKMS